jgi:hypothetical protein
MANRKSVNFLPTVFQTQTNRKFLNATMDQLIQEPSLEQVYGYIGQQDLSPNYQSNDYYIKESDDYSQFYQLEPGLIVRKKLPNSNNFVNENAYTYIDMLNQISSDGGVISNHSRMFTQEFYSYNAFCDLDKLVNYRQYYWSPSGPVAVNVSGDTKQLPVSSTEIYMHRNRYLPTVAKQTVDIAKQGYAIDGFKNQTNPTIYLTRGVTYNFHVDQPGYKFWIQSETGTDQYSSLQQNMNVRDVWGVYNNGTDSGAVRFVAPLTSAQDQWLGLAEFDTIVDIVLDVPFNSIQGANYNTLTHANGLDGIKTFGVKNVIFTNPGGWPNTVTQEQRRGVWRLTVVNGIVQLDYNRDFPRGYKVFVREGLTYGHLYVYRDALGRIVRFPEITANLDTLYYCDGENPDFYGVIRLIEPDPITLMDVNHIIGQAYYTSPNGIEFTSGLKVRFTGPVTPAEYSTGEWLVENVGKSIRLINWSEFVTPEMYNNYLGSQYDVDGEPYDTTGYDANKNNPNVKDYMMVSRASRDRNAWSRNNRWFHKDVLQYAADKAGVELSLDNNFQGQRPIVEMLPDLQLYNHGKNFLKIVNVYDDSTTDAFNQIEGQNNFGLKTEFFEIAAIQFSPAESNYIVLPGLEARANGLTYTVQAGQTVSGLGIPMRTVITRIDERTNTIYLNNTVTQDIEVDTLIFFGQYNSDGIELNDGVTIVFANDTRPEVRSTIYQVRNIHAFAPRDVETRVIQQFSARNTKNKNRLYITNTYGITTTTKVTGNGIRAGTYVTSINAAEGYITINQNLSQDISVGSEVHFHNDTTQVRLEPVAIAREGDVIVANSGLTYQGVVFHFHNGYWHKSQQKLGLPQAPVYDVIDSNGYSFSDHDVYPSSNFAGSRLFGYADNTGTSDKEVGVPLKYQTIGNLGDIVFSNFYENDTFVYNKNFKDQLLDIKNGFAFTNLSDGSIKLQNGWSKVHDKSEQKIVYSKDITFVQVNNFIIPMVYRASNYNTNVQIRVNNKILKKSQYTLNAGIENSELILANDLTNGDRLVVCMVADSKNFKDKYTIPINLTDNSANEIFETVTLGQMRNHVIELSNNLLEFSGDGAGINNLRDIDYSNSYGKLLQHSAGVHVHAMQNVNPNTNMVNIIRFNMNNYGQYKLQLFDKINNSEFAHPEDYSNNLDQILLELNQNVNDTTATYTTDMLAFGTNYIRNEYNIQNLGYRSFNLTRSYDSKPETYQAVLVYKNAELLIKDRDYAISGFIVTLDPDLLILRTDKIRIYEYMTTLACGVPATPTKLGLYPSFVPEIIFDNTYLEPTLVVIGHDGSVTPAWGDYRDNILLEYEKRVYNNLDAYYQNDRITDLYSVLPGAFRRTDYSIEEWTQLLSSSYLEWSGLYNVDVFSNNLVTDNEFSFNYSTAKDKLFNETLPGYWRGIYNYFFDTDRPDTHPWEMLGFSKKPDWWENYYGPAPYTSQNTVLWADLEMGKVYNGNPKKSYINSYFSRPGLSAIIPVDSHGKLLDPTKFIISQLPGGVKTTNGSGSASQLLIPSNNTVTNSSWNQNSVTNNWRIGDQSPQETSWRRSSYYPFAVQIAWLLARPAEYASLKFNTRDVGRNLLLDQIVNRNSNSRMWDSTVTSMDMFIPGTNVWLVDYLADKNLDLYTNWTEYVANTRINLTYKMAAFTDKKHIQLVADQISPQTTNKSILIPAENYDVVFSKSSTISRAVYSAVAITKTSDGYQVYGFDNIRPYFLVIPSLLNGNSYTVTVGNESGTIYRDSVNNVVTYPYGTIFVNKQQVVDFLISYGRYLTSQGFVFDDVLADSQTVQDWILSVKEFLFWQQQNWGEGVVISLTPAGTVIKFKNLYGTVDAISNRGDFTRVLDSDNRVLTGTDYRVYREGNAFEISLKDAQKGIHLLDIAVVQYEHSIVLDNVTIFNDIIYEPNIGNRQYRLRLTGYKTRDWDGSLYAPGFLVNTRHVEPWQPYKDYHKGDIILFKTRYYTAKQFISGNSKFEQSQWYEISGELLSQKLIPTPTFNAAQGAGFYNIDKQNINADADMLGRHGTGFAPRNYFADLGLNTVSQHKFYLGMLKQKGSQAVINAFIRAKNPYQDSSIVLNEQFAIRLDQFGNTEQQHLYEIDLKNIKSLNNQYGIEFLSQSDSASTGMNGFKPTDLIQRPDNYTKNIFADESARKVFVSESGPVRPGEVSASIFSISKLYDINGLNKVLGEGSLIWVASDQDNQWAVHRISQIDRVLIIQVNQSGPGEITFTTNIPHNFSILDIIMLKSTTLATSGSGINTLDIGGFYVITDVTAYTIMVKTKNNINLVNGIVNTVVFKLVNVRFADRSEFMKFTPGNGWQQGDLAYIDNTASGYKVLQNTNSWVLTDTRSPIYTRVTDRFGTSIAINKTQKFAVVGSPGRGVTGSLIVYTLNLSNSWEEITSLTPDSSARHFGQSVSINDMDYVAIGAPNSNNCGSVYIGKVGNTSMEITQVLHYEQGASSRFGSSVAFSSDGTWLYVGDPYNQSVYAYRYTEVNESVQFYTGDNGNIDYEMPNTALLKKCEANDIIVIKDFVVQVPNVDYYKDPDLDVIHFFTPPAAGAKIYVHYRNYYKLQTVITTDAPDNERFGHALSSDATGRTLVITDNTKTFVDPLTSRSYANQGVAYVLDRTVERFVAGLEQTEYTVMYDFSQVKTVVNSIGVRTSEPYYANPVVYVNHKQVSNFTVRNNKIILSVAPALGMEVLIETQQFTILSTLNSPLNQNNLNFGESAVINEQGTNVFIGAPGYFYTNSQNGTIFRYDNYSRHYNSITGYGINLRVPPQTNMFINDVRVHFGFGNSTDIVDRINNAAVPGVTAKLNADTTLTINLDPAVTTDRLKLREYSNLTDYYNSQQQSLLPLLGITQFTMVQQILSPYIQDTERFGENISLSPDGQKLVVGATSTTSSLYTSFDNYKTTFDGRTIKTFRDKIYRSGGVHVYEYQESSTETVTDQGGYAFATSLRSPTLSANSLYGTSVAITDNWLMVSAPNGLVNKTEQGLLHMYHNPESGRIWKTVRAQPAKHNSNLISHAYLYDTKKRSKITDLLVLDPVYGKQLPNSIRNLDYITNYDPAVYNNTPYSATFNTDPRNVWFENQLGKLWWDTNSMKYMDYTQGDSIYRLNTWGLSFPNSTVAVYEWIESEWPPKTWRLQYPNNLPLYLINDVYSTKTQIDPNTNTSVTRYYFWVRSGTFYGKNAIEIQNNMANLRQQPDPFVAVLDTNLLGLYNCENIITDSTTLVIKTSSDKDTIIHSEWSLFDDGSDLGAAPEFYKKIKDSLSGQDTAGRVVPDLELPEKMRYGTSIRPRQTMFADRFAARKLFIEQLNMYCATNPMVLLRRNAIEKLTGSDEVPQIGTYRTSVNNLTELGYLNLNLYKVGDLVLVLSDSEAQDQWSLKKLEQVNYQKYWYTIKVQTYNINRYWSYTDWYSANYNQNARPTYTINTEADVAKLNLRVGNIVYIKNSAEGGWKYIVVKSNSLELLAQQNATIQFSSKLYDNTVAGFGIDSTSFETTPFAQDCNIEFAKIFDIIVNDLMTSEFRNNFKSIIKLLINIIVTQVQDPDFLQKTSLVDIYHRVRGLDQIPIFVPQPETTVTDFFNEVKPFHTVLKQYVAKYDNTNSVESASINLTDFDLQPYFSYDDKKYHSPQLNRVTDVAALHLPVYQPWVNHHSYSVMEIVVDQPGTGYTPDNITIDIKGDGTGALARGRVINGKLHTVVVDNPGSGYSYANILIYGLGQGATAYAKLGKGLVRSFDTVIKYDRYLYNYHIFNWTPGTQYNVHDVVVYNNQPYRTTVAHKTNKFVLLNFNLLTIKVWYSFTEYNSTDIFIYEHQPYIINQTAYESKYGSIASTIISSQLWSDFVSANFVVPFPGNSLNNAADRIWAYYAPQAGMAGKDLAQVMRGIDYPGVRVIGQDFNQNPGYDVNDYDEISYDLQEYDENGLPIIYGKQALDTVYYSLFTDQNLGLRPQDILTDGGKFLDEYSTHAPEELVPGQIFDTLEIRVKTQAVTAKGFYYNPEIVNVSYYSDGITDKFSWDPVKSGVELPAGGVEHIIVNVDKLGTLIEGTDYIIDYAAKTVNFIRQQTTTGINAITVGNQIYIMLIGITGKNPVASVTYTSDGAQREYLIPDISLRTAQQVYTKVNGIITHDFHLTADPNGVILRFDQTIPAGLGIDIKVFNMEVSQKAYAQIEEQTFTVQAGNYPNTHTFTLDNPVLYAEPYTAYAIVKLNNQHLVPSQQIYYKADGISVRYVLNSLRRENHANISDGEITVSVNGERQILNLDYTVSRTSTGGNPDWPVVVFRYPPRVNTNIIISDSSHSDYRVFDNRILIISPNVMLQPDDKISVLTFSNHDMIDLKTVVYSGNPDSEITVDLGWDPASVGLDSYNYKTGNYTSAFDNTQVTVRRDAVLRLPVPVYNPSDLYLVRNGRIQNVYVDYAFFSPVEIKFNSPVADEELIVVRIFDSSSKTRSTEFRLFKDLHDQNSYYRVTDRKTCTLAQDLYITDHWIYVDNVDRLADPDPRSNNPGICFVNGERIVFGVKDRINNRLGNIRRGTAGTGGAYKHPSGSRVADANLDQIIPESADTVLTTTQATRFRNNVGQIITVPTGTKLKQNRRWQLLGESITETDTVQAKFIRSY